MGEAYFRLRGQTLTHNDNEELREFVKELSSVALSGQALSIVSGFHLALWGVVVAAACFLNIVVTVYTLPFQVRPELIWVGATGVGWISGRYLQKRLNQEKRPGASTYANRVTRYVWVGIGFLATFTILVEANAFVDFGGRGYFFIFMLCAIGLVATAAAGSEPLLLLSGAGWLGAGVMSLFFPPTATFTFGITLISCIVFLVLPGLIIGLRR